MRVNIWLVITILVIQVTSSMTARSVEAALAKQLDKKGYAILQLKKKRLVLRDTDENDIDKHNYHSNKAHKKVSKTEESIPADRGLKKKFIKSKDMHKLANTNLGRNRNYYNYRHKRNEKEDKDNLLTSAENDELETVKKEQYAEANAIAAAIESEEVREDIDSQNENTNDNDSNPKEETKSTNEESENDSKIENHAYVYDDKESVSNEDHEENHKKVSSKPLEGNSEDKDTKEPSKDISSGSCEENPTNSCKTATLAKDVGTVFSLLAKEEKHLLEKFEHLEASLEKSAKTLEDAGKEFVLQRQRRAAAANKALSDVMTSLTKDDIAKLLARSKRATENGGHHACVYIDAPTIPSPEEYSDHKIHHLPPPVHTYNDNANSWNDYSAQESYGQSQYENSNSINGQDYSNVDYSAADHSSQDYSNSVDQETYSQNHNTETQFSDEDLSNTASHSEVTEYGQQSMGESIDLHSIYWLKLPKVYDNPFDEKVYSLLRGISHTQRDILIIPVSRSYTSREDLTDGFLRAVRVTPTSKRAQYFTKKLNFRLIK